MENLKYINESIITGNVIDVKTIAQNHKGKVKEVVDKYPHGNFRLSVIQVGDNPASNSYIKGKKKDCEEVGIGFELLKYPENVKPWEIYEVIKKLNKDQECTGVIIQLPLPEQFSLEVMQVIMDCLSTKKDVDGFKKGSMFTPCTPKGIISILHDIGIDLSGKVCCVIGRSEIVGKPLVKLLIEESATVISCNSKTKDLDMWLQSSDIIISAVGKIDFLNEEREVNWSNKIVIDVGINRTEEGRLAGDCSKEIYPFLKAYTPVPGGVGLMTRVSLLENLVQNY